MYSTIWARSTSTIGVEAELHCAIENVINYLFVFGKPCRTDAVDKDDIIPTCKFAEESLSHSADKGFGFPGIPEVCGGQIIAFDPRQKSDSRYVALIAKLITQLVVSEVPMSRTNV